MQFLKVYILLFNTGALISIIFTSGFSRVKLKEEINIQRNLVVFEDMGLKYLKKNPMDYTIKVR